jgi:translation initiation factor 3 subunit E
MATPKAEKMVQYDLTQKIVPYLDPHLVLPLLRFLEGTGMYNAKDMLKAEVDLLSKTNMVDEAIDKAKQLAGTDDEPSDLVEKKEEILEDSQEMQSKVKDLLELIDDDEKYGDMRKIKVVREIIQTFNLQPDAMESLFSFGKLQYEAGQYEMAFELLKHFRLLSMHDSDKSYMSKQLPAMWGQLASNILDTSEEESQSYVAELVLKLDESYESTALKLSRYELVLNRTWPLHWTLFPIFKSTQPQAQKKLIEFFLHDSSLQIISISCPHLLRYVAALLILHKHLQEHRAEELLAKLQQDSFWYSDPITQFLEELYRNLDFDAAQAKLEESVHVLAGDYFLADQAEKFQESCRLLIFETYCRIHKHVKLSMLAEKLSMPAKDAEVWIVKLIQQAKLDAKIDAEQNRVLMTRYAPNVYQQVLDKTKNLAHRTNLVNAALDKRTQQA